MKVKVKKLWKGFVAFRDKYIKEAQEANEDIQVEVQGKTMTIPLAELETKMKFKKPEPDKFGRGMQNLVYYWFEPDKKSKKQKKIEKAWKEANKINEEHFFKKYVL